MSASAVAPALSVVVPTFERRDLVARAVASVLDQSYRDFEVIVIDDGSLDRAEPSLAPLAGPVRYVWQPNRGVSAARNEGIRLARGEIVAFLDSDDWWLPEHLAVLTRVLSQNPRAVLASTCPSFSIGGRERPEEARIVEAFPLVAAETLPGYPSGIAVRRSDVLAVGGFDERLPVFEDRDLWLRLARRGPFALLRRRTLVRERTPGSLRRRGSRDGLYPRAFVLSAEREVADLDALSYESPLYAARAAAEARLCLARALLALDRGDELRARSELAAACQAHPGLGRERELVAKRIALTASGPRDRLRRLAAIARLWPDGGETATYLCALTAEQGRRDVVEPSRRLDPARLSARSETAGTRRA